jgi:hypothetical protein
LVSGLAAVIYTVVAIFDVFEDSFNVPTVVHGYIRAALAIGLTVSAAAWFIDRSAARNRDYFARRLDALTNATVEAGLRSSAADVLALAPYDKGYSDGLAKRPVRPTGG